jgi:hypothetical protein
VLNFPLKTYDSTAKNGIKEFYAKETKKFKKTPIWGWKTEHFLSLDLIFLHYNR